MMELGLGFARFGLREPGPPWPVPDFLHQLYYTLRELFSWPSTQHTRSKILAMSGQFLCTEYPDDKYVLHVAKFVNMWSC